MEDRLQNNENASGSGKSPGEGFSGGFKKPDLKAAMRLYIIVFILLLSLGAIAQTLHFEIGMIITQVILILLPAVWFLRRYRVNWVEFSRLKTLQLKFVPTIIFLALSMWILNMILAAGLVTGLMELGYEPVIVIEPPQTFREYLILVLILSVFAGICEEVLFRGAIMPSMEGRGLIPAIIYSSMLFALFHITFLNLLSAFILGIVIAVVVIKTGSLWGGIVYHMANNFIAATYLYIAGRQEVATEIDPQALLAALPLFLLALGGSYIGLRLLQKQSKAEPLLENRRNWLPEGWFGVAFAVAVLLFLIMAILELAIGFNWIDLNQL